MGSRSHTLYIGFTSDIETRVKQHKNHTYAGFSADYRCERLLYFERYGEPYAAIGREKQLKRWRREKKWALIKAANPTLLDLSEPWGKPIAPYREPKEGDAGPSTA
jgi:putative endonuclease